MCQATRVQPPRPFVWVFGEVGGVQVWAADGDRRVRAAVLIGDGSPIVVVNRRLVGTPDERDAVGWAVAMVAERGAGFYVLTAQP